MTYSPEMETAGIVVLSIFGGILFVVLIAAIATLIVLQLRGQKLQKELLVSLEGARASFASIRQDIRTALESQSKDLRETLGSVNGPALEAAAVKGMRAAGKLEAVAGAMQRLLIAHETPQVGQELAPEEYGPSDTIYSRQADSARVDAVDEQEELNAIAPEFSNQQGE